MCIRDSVGVWLPDVEHVHLRQTALDFPESKGFLREDALQPIEGSVIGKVFKAGKPVLLDLNREQLAAHVSPNVRAEGLESGCALPLISRGRTLGVLTLGSRIENSISPEDVDFLLRAAGQLAIAIENRLAYRELAELKDKLAQEKLYLEDEIRGEIDFEGIVGQSSALRHVLKLVETVAPSDSTVCLLYTSFTAVMPGTDRVCAVRIPTVHGKIGVSTSNHEPAGRIRSQESTTSHLNSCSVVMAQFLLYPWLVTPTRDRGLWEIGCQNREFADLFPLPCTTPVSYTHLDVYKRQDQGGGRCSF